VRSQAVGVVVDDTVIAAFSEGKPRSLYVESLVAWLAREGRPLVVPASAVAAAGLPAVLARWGTVTDLTEAVAVEVQRIGNSVGVLDLVAAHAVYEAIHLTWPIVTGTPQRYEPFGPGLNLETF
jgi:hypothetical protein